MSAQNEPQVTEELPGGASLFEMCLLDLKNHTTRQETPHEVAHVGCHRVFIGVITKEMVV